MTSPAPSPASSPLPSTIAGPVEHELVLKKSRFLTLLHPVATVADADAVIAHVRKEHWDARHHCTALVVGAHADQQRSNDDGEPSGTAGIPMLEVLRHRHVTDVVAVVTRYFGGVLLGAGGLVRAYSNAVSETLDLAPMVRREVMAEVTVDVPHAEAGRIGNMLHEWCASHGAVLDGADYGSAASFRILVPPARLAALDADLASSSRGALSPEVGDSRIVDVPA
ncbi:YigZ family protein [Oerskovia turbata]|uniref:YigZ family protein n=1 Tax=Oerskovia turbata TaxID=1713 RepID=A0A4Q1KYW0_9CELL|nr:YigZ family protein [Oerskovia turbata]RXR24866.1 YigZ family protein [Oerskovia turbata]RXR34930.1 YigZ family protein [Oerskovia turbata]TGJ96986.1 YigZ family protein [Actinotalea fermentans ATCC 43279 = JCM 9966 = DSM 3133]